MNWFQVSQIHFSSKVYVLLLSFLIPYPTYSQNTNGENTNGQEDIKHIYWTDAVYQRILRVDTDGQHFTEIISEGLGFPWRLAVDSIHDKIYWTSVDANFVQRANLDGSEIENLLLVTYPQGLCLDLLNGKMYIAEAGTPQIIRTDLDGNNEEVMINEGILDPEDIQIDSPNNRLYWVDVALNTIQWAHIGTKEVHQLNIGRFSKPSAIDLDQIENKIYWSDKEAGKIKRANPDGSEMEEVITGLKKPSGITLDVYNKKIYWTDTATNNIYQADYNGKQVKVVIKGEVNNFHAGITLN